MPPLNELAGYGGEHRIVITRDGAMDELLVRVEAAPAIARRSDPGACATLRDAAAQKLLTHARPARRGGDRARPGTFPRTDFKARRVVDDREVFRELNAQLAGGS